VALFEPVLAALDAAGVRFVVVGGVAVVLHGHPRMTAERAAGRPQDLADIAALKALGG